MALGGAPAQWRGEFTGYSGSSHGPLTSVKEDDGPKWEGDPAKFSMIQRLRHGTQREQTYGPKYRILCANYNAEGTRICTASEDKTARVFDRITRKQLVRILHPDLVRFSVISNSGKQLCTACDDMFARIWDIEDGSETRLEKINEFVTGNWATSVTYSKEDRLLLVSSRDRMVRIVELARLASLSETDEKPNPIKWKQEDPIYHASFSPDEQYIATAAGSQRFNGVCKVYATERGEADFGGNQTAEPLAKLDHADAVTTATFSPDGKFLFTSSLDGTAQIFDRRMYDQVGTFKHPNWVTSVNMTKDGRNFCTACQDGIIRIYDVGTRKQVQAFSTGEPLSWAVFSPSDLEVMSTSLESVVSIWGIEGRLGHHLQQHKEALETVSLARDQPDVPADQPAS